VDTTPLVRQAQAGNDQAMERLLGIWRPRLVRRALALVRNEDAAQDIAQETLVKVFRNLDRLTNAAAFPGWIYVILRRVVIASRRSSPPDREVAIGCDDSCLTACAIDSFRSTQDRMELAECLSLLKQEDKLLLEQHYWGGHELKELAPRLGIATGAAKTRLFRARGRFGELLSEQP